jgi:hypothetical protein
MKKDGIAALSDSFIIMWLLPVVIFFGVVLLFFPAERPFTETMT